MDPEVKKVKLNGSSTKKGNYLWGGALTLAWQHLRDEIIKENITLANQSPIVQEIVHNFNHSPFNKAHLSPQSYYAKAGYGNQTVRLINSEVAKKFPGKSTSPLKENLDDSGIIGFAYFFKQLMFHFPFEKSEVMFNGSKVRGFEGKTQEQKEQVLVHEYKDRDNFIVSLETKSQKDQVLIIKQEEKFSAEEIVEKVKKVDQYGKPLTEGDEFTMPKIEVKHERQLKELIGQGIQNEKFKGFFFSEIYEIIKLDIDETGVKAENEGAIAMKGGMIIPLWKKQILVDKSFWLVMKEKGKEPYLVAFISEASDQ